MARTVTLFSGQWADLPAAETFLKKTKSFGYDGVELGCWGDHFEVAKADQKYCDAKRALIKKARTAVPRDQRAPRRPGGVRFD